MTMEIPALLSNFTSPPILFFMLGLLAVFVKSDLQIPQPAPKLFAMYLLMAIGLKGGHELYESGINSDVLTSLTAAIALACIVPIYSFYILRTKIDVKNSAAIAATYGSVSAVTFITAITFLENKGISFGGHMVASMALMESPAIAIGVLLARFYSGDQSHIRSSKTELLRESLFNGSVLLIIGSLIIGYLSGKEGYRSIEPFTGDIFKGVLCFFLLDMGLLAGSRIKDLKSTGSFLIMFALLIPLLNASLGILLAQLLGLSVGDAFLLIILGASASYIAVPAAMRLAVPEANPSLYVPMALAITFPFNITIGLPLYMYIVNKIWS